jgi:hypothetical protein
MTGKPILMTAMLLAAGPAFAQATDTAPAAATTEITDELIYLEKDEDLRFGSIVRPAAGSSVVTVDPVSGNRTLNNSNAVLVGGGAGRAEFTVSGVANQTFSIDAPATTPLTHQGAGNPITVNLVPSASGGTLDGNTGSATFGVGGNFTLLDDAAYGLYTGTFNVTVIYD